MRLDYYSQSTVNLDEMYENGMGILSAVGCIFATFLLFLVSFSTDFPRKLILIYCTKNLIVICYAIFALTKLGLEFKTNREALVDKKLYSLAVCVMEILVPIYFTIIAIFFFRDIVTVPNIADVKLKIKAALKKNQIEELEDDEKEVPKEEEEVEELEEDEQEDEESSEEV
jgi:hypothetical protein